MAADWFPKILTNVGAVDPKRLGLELNTFADEVGIVDVKKLEEFVSNILVLEVTGVAKIFVVIAGAAPNILPVETGLLKDVLNMLPDIFVGLLENILGLFAVTNKFGCDATGVPNIIVVEGAVTKLLELTVIAGVPPNIEIVVGAVKENLKGVFSVFCSCDMLWVLANNAGELVCGATGILGNETPKIDGLISISFNDSDFWGFVGLGFHSSFSNSSSFLHCSQVQSGNCL